MSVINLTVHRIDPARRDLDRDANPTWIDVGQFQQVLDAIVQRPDVRITFDDGYSSDVEIALPLLLERGLTAQFFVLAGRLGSPGHLGEDDIDQLRRSGMSIGSHGWSHRNWRGLNNQDAAQEIIEAKRVLTEIVGDEVTSVAIPFGAYDRVVLRRLKQAGVTRAYTSDGGRSREGSWLQARTSLLRNLDTASINRILADSYPLATRMRGQAARVVKRWRR